MIEKLSRKSDELKEIKSDILNSPWCGKDIEFAMKYFSYYICFVCKKPYFAGKKYCHNDSKDNYNPEEYLCDIHSNLKSFVDKSICPKHGKNFIVYKCRFCCRKASRLSWGTTHFCENCHKRQCNGDYVSKYPKDRLPKCDKSTCEVGGNHPPNGEEFALGCSMCGF